MIMPTSDSAAAAALSAGTPSSRKESQWDNSRSAAFLSVLQWWPPSLLAPRLRAEQSRVAGTRTTQQAGGCVGRLSCGGQRHHWPVRLPGWARPHQGCNSSNTELETAPVTGWRGDCCTAASRPHRLESPHNTNNICVSEELDASSRGPACGAGRRHFVHRRLYCLSIKKLAGQLLAT